MERLFNTDSVTIVRKKSDYYVREEINTAPVLSDYNQDSGRIRSSVIARLRKDPSVILVLEDRGGRADEMITLAEGFEMAVSLVDGETPSATLAVFHQGEKVFEDSLSLTIDLITEVIDILECIQNHDYSFVEDGCTHFTKVERGEPVDLLKAQRIMNREGFQTETLVAVGDYRPPFIFVHENDVILLGARLLEEEALYLEMKRFFNGANPASVRKTAESINREYGPVEVFEREDGSWSFRAVMDEDLDTGNFIERLLSDIAGIREVIARMESSEGVGSEPWATLREQRQFFCYETIDTALKMKRLHL